MKEAVVIKKLQHIAFILDGNGRWAKERKKPRTYGHKIGMQNIFPTILNLKKYNIKYVTLFCFSTENWNRPKKEIEYLMKFPSEIFSEKKKKQYLKEDIKINWIGRRNIVPDSVRKILEDLENETRECKTIIVNFAFDYGSFVELENSFKIVLNNIINNQMNINEFSIQNIIDNLYTKNIPPVDLLIRTGGEQRISNFMLLQLAYSELYFTKVYWPDFSKDDLKEAIEDFNLRDRRFGGIMENEKK